VAWGAAVTIASAITPVKLNRVQFTAMVLLDTAKDGLHR
jgi:hypothetical protein